MNLKTFVDKWQHSRAEERSNKDGFLYDLTDILGVPRPEPKTGDPERDRYVFEHDVPTLLEDGKVSTRKVDLYKHGSFILEAKQGSEPKDPKEGFARRRTPKWDLGMGEAYGQATGYASSMDDPPPFIVICDIGYCFDLYASFDRAPHRAFPNALRKRIWFKDLADDPKLLDTLRKIWTDPYALDPSRHAAKITREVAASIAELARSLEDQGHPSEVVAKFLMRCLFTMFAEDVGLLPERSFTKMIKEYWLPNPPSFASPGGVPALWRTMNSGGSIPLLGDILRFNGGLFADTSAVPLTKANLQLLLLAAERDWAEVEPAIFGTLLERALNKKERHMLGAHFTPRAYVERLVRPTIEEPLREEWENVQASARKLRLDEKAEEARKLVHEFLRKLCGLRVLDPACGTGNFLYVALDLFKRIESEVLALLRELGEVQEKLLIEGERVTPKQFLGIEVKPWAKEIADLVLWIGFLQWHYRTHGKAMAPPEPVLWEYKNIECRDAVLAWDGEPEIVCDKQTGKPVTRWDGVTYKASTVTGDDVPDERAQIETYTYRNTRAASWPPADFIVGNPPYIGVRVMRQTLDPAYVDALRGAYPDVPETSDLVMYWWHKAATGVESGRTRRFGLITTDKLSDAYSRRIVEQHINATPGVRLIFAIDKHPWPDEPMSAAVRVAMTVAESASGTSQPTIGSVIEGADESDAGVILRSVPTISAALKIASTSGSRVALRSNARLCFQGVVPANDGFKLTMDGLLRLGYEPSQLPPVIKRYIIGKDLVGKPVPKFVIDFFGLDQDMARTEWPNLFQILLEGVLPERKHNPRKSYRERWWLFAETRPAMRAAVRGLSRFIVTPYTAVHRPFIFVPEHTVPDAMAYAVAASDAYVLGVLSSKIHHCFALDAGSALEDRPRYNSKSTFFPFPFPACSDVTEERIRALAESLDAHRKRQQAQHPDLTITGMYNVLEKLRKAEPLMEKDKTIHEHGLISVLKQIHDDLDAAVFAAYGWPADLTDEQLLQKLVDLNAVRAEEERKNQIRWLRPDFQNPTGSKQPTQEALIETEEAGDETEAGASPEAKAWPKKLPEKIAAVRDRMTAWGRAASAEEVASAFKRAPRKDVEDMLDSLAAVGVLTVLETEAGKRWKATTRAA